MHDNHLTCTECGCADVARAGGMSTPLSTFARIECPECGATGKATFRNDTTDAPDVREGPFAVLSTDGVRTLRANL